ncbi:MAG TPA: hypothetical protein VFF12_11190, partial [Myxococcaceae bacterium]|nr:hypothetical protein [Myxococcaceae bacterium]
EICLIGIDENDSASLASIDVLVHDAGADTEDVRPQLVPSHDVGAVELGLQHLQHLDRGTLASVGMPLDHDTHSLHVLEGDLDQRHMEQPRESPAWTSSPVGITLSPGTSAFISAQP